MFGSIEFRGFSHDMVEERLNYSGVPVWNGLTDSGTQLKYLQTRLFKKKKLGRLEGLTLVYCGDGRNSVAAGS